MTFRFRCRIAILVGFLTGAATGAAVELAPNDPAVSASLALWLRHPDADYDAGGGLWSDSSGRGNNASMVGQAGAIFYAAPILATVPGGTLKPTATLTGVRFQGNTNDLLGTVGLNGAAGLSNLTVIAVSRSSDASNLTRPVGFGSISAFQANPGNHFNLANDPSLRKDNGAITGYSAGLPVGNLFVRSARMDAGGLDEWFNTAGTPTAVITNGGAAFTTSTSRFFVGDLRCGPTAVTAVGGGVSTADIDVIEVAVYTSALTDAQIFGINEWMVARLGGTPPPVISSYTAAPAAIASGESSMLSWTVGGATAVSIAPQPGAVAISGSAMVSPLVTTTYTLTATGDGGQTTAQITIGVDVPVDDPFISEFLASNGNSLDDEDGASSDWIELANPNAFMLDLGGYYLSDNPALPTLWRVPDGVMLPGGGHLIVFASGKNRAVAGAELHANFALARSGGYLALVAPDGSTVVSSFAPAYPVQIADVSYGPDSGGLVRFLSPPTPGAANGSGFDGKVSDTKFSVKRGFYEAPFNVAITTATAGAEIRYTLDGSLPTATSGTVYAGPVAITTTRVLRAAAFKAGFIPTNVDTQTYLFLADVLRQPANPPGFPSTWGTRVPDYAMDARVVDAPAYSGEMLAAMKSIRTLSIVVPQNEFFNNPRGIYANPQNDGIAWERVVSMEFLHPEAPTRNVQANAGIRIHGNGSRSAGGQPKHGFRVEFRGEYGAKRLNYRLFPGLAIDQFDSLILRGQNAHGWTRDSQIANNVGTTEREQSQYIRDSYARDLMKSMGHVAGEATYVHLYINGLYWGLYNPVEYPRTYFGVSHFGGEDEDYDVINRRTTTTSILDGTFQAWDAMQALANGGLTTRVAYEAMETHIDIDNLIDYMLMHQYMGSRDGPEVFNSNNMRAIRKTRGAFTGQWLCMPWDMEAGMFEIDVTRNVNVDDPNTLVRVYTKLRENPEFRLRYADRVRRHCFNGGTLTPAKTAAIWETRATEIYGAILGESARWGDYRRASLPFTRNAEWQQERNRLLTTYFPTRTAFLVNLLRQNSLYPQTTAPDFSQHGGSVPANYALAMTAPQGTIYYTLDGSDPREAWTANAVGAPYATPVNLGASVRVRARALNAGVWSALTEATFLVGTLAAPGNLVVSELMYNPSGPSEELEFLEIRNISSELINLSGVSLGGVDFVFPTGYILASGGYALVVADASAFQNAYGAGLPVAGTFQNGTALANGGERVTLFAADGTTVIETFRYRDTLPWPTAADGLGPSLTRIAPLTPGDPESAASWRASVFAGGTPGSSDAVGFTGDPEADDDGDGISAFAEHAFGSSDSHPDGTGDLFTVSANPVDGAVTLEYQSNPAADDVRVLIEDSTDLSTWRNATSEFSVVGRVWTSGGNARVSLREITPVPGRTSRYLRFRFESR